MDAIENLLGYHIIADPTVETSNTLALSDFFDIAIQLATSLDGLIHQRVIHKDIAIAAEDYRILRSRHLPS